MPKATRAGARNVRHRQVSEPGTNGWPTGQVNLKIHGVAVGECVTKHISDYPPEEQERMMKLEDHDPNHRHKRHIASAYGDRLKQARRNAQ